MVKLLVIACCLFTVFFCSIQSVDIKLSCVDAGDCRICSSDEMNEDYCKESGKKMKVQCTGKGLAKQDDFRSCYLTAADEQLRVLLFQVAMAVIGGLAYWGVQNRKQNNSTLFEQRKQRRTRESR